MNDASEGKNILEEINGDWMLRNVGLDSRQNHLIINLDQWQSDWSGIEDKACQIFCNGLVDLSYSPHVFDPPPTLIRTIKFDVVMSELDLSEQEGFFQRKLGAYGDCFPMYRLAFDAWECRLNVVCRDLTYSIS